MVKPVSFNICDPSASYRSNGRRATPRAMTNVVVNHGMGRFLFHKQRSLSVRFCQKDAMYQLRAALLLLAITFAHGVAVEPQQALRTDAAQADRVVELPGAKAEDLSFDLFSGCVQKIRRKGQGTCWHGRSHPRHPPRLACPLFRVSLSPAIGRYVTVDDDAGRALFYVLAESEGSPATDPLVLWLNGVCRFFPNHAAALTIFPEVFDHEESLPHGKCFLRSNTRLLRSLRFMARSRRVNHDSAAILTGEMVDGVWGHER